MMQSGSLGEAFGGLGLGPLRQGKFVQNQLGIAQTVALVLQSVFNDVATIKNRASRFPGGQNRCQLITSSCCGFSPPVSSRASS